MATFRAASCDMLANQILCAKERVVLMAPGVSQEVVKALVDAKQRSLSVTVILDADEDVCRIGYGDVEGFRELQACASEMELRKHPGVRLGLLMADKAVTIWSPTPQSVDGERQPDQPNAIVLEGGILQGRIADGRVGSTQHERTEDKAELGIAGLADQLAKRLTEDHVGETRIQPEEIQAIVKGLNDNPPAPFDLARKVRVFSTRFQFVETELQGAEWTDRRIKVSSLLLNSDLPDSLHNVLETQIRPYGTKGDVAIEVPHIVRGQIAYNQHGKEIHVPTTQRDMEATWRDIRNHYLFTLPGFGSLVRKQDLPSLRAEIKAFERVLRDWVAGFLSGVKQNEDALVDDIVRSIERRLEQSARKEDFRDINLGKVVRAGLARMRVIPPRVRVVIKNVSWESSRDQEFTSALRKALPAEDLSGWFDEFTAVKERR